MQFSGVVELTCSINSNGSAISVPPKLQTSIPFRSLSSRLVASMFNFFFVTGSGYSLKTKEFPLKERGEHVICEVQRNNTDSWHTTYRCKPYAHNPYTRPLLRRYVCNTELTIWSMAKNVTFEAILRKKYDTFVKLHKLTLKLQLLVLFKLV